MKQELLNEKMRSILIDWLIEVHEVFRHQPETLYITVYIIDSFLDKNQVKKDKFQLVGITALLIACKYQEIVVPSLTKLNYITDDSYSKKEIILKEYEIISSL